MGLIMRTACGVGFQVSEQDFEELRQHRWLYRFSRNNQTIYRQMRMSVDGQTRRILPVWRHIMRASPGQLVDHVNRDRLDNRRENLRFCTKAQNTQNGLRMKRGVASSSSYRGVFFSKTARRWYSEINAGGKRYYLGLYDTQEKAALAYDAAALDKHGDFAVLNFPIVSCLPPSESGDE